MISSRNMVQILQMRLKKEKKPMKVMNILDIVIMDFKNMLLDKKITTKITKLSMLEEISLIS